MNFLKKLLPIFAITIMLLPAVEIDAQTTYSGSSTTVNAKLDNPFRGAGNTLPDLFAAIINRILLPIGSIVAVVMFIWTGFMFVTAQGDPGKLKTAKAALLYTAIGTAILLGATMLANVIANTINSLRG
jgi:hypothetical protein